MNEQRLSALPAFSRPRPRPQAAPRVHGYAGHAVRVLAILAFAAVIVGARPAWRQGCGAGAVCVSGP